MLCQLTSLVTTIAQEHSVPDISICCRFCSTLASLCLSTSDHHHYPVGILPYYCDATARPNPSCRTKTVAFPVFHSRDCVAHTTTDTTRFVRPSGPVAGPNSLGNRGHTRCRDRNVPRLPKIDSWILDPSVRVGRDTKPPEKECVVLESKTATTTTRERKRERVSEVCLCASPLAVPAQNERRKILQQRAFTTTYHAV